MMSKRELCDQIAPLVLELQEECREMPVDEFEKFRDDVMREVKKQNLNQSFMRATFDVIYANLFEKHVA
jgi:hypothetical protein